jgi:hypothetical protein
VLDLFEELKGVLDKLNECKVPYALCGGMAMAAHGFPRATVDIDLLVPENAIPRALEALKAIGYAATTDLTLGAGTVFLTRALKFDSTSDDYLVIDVLHASGALETVFDDHSVVSTRFGDAVVLSKEALIKMKRIRNSAQDVADIENLSGKTDGN